MPRTVPNHLLLCVFLAMIGMAHAGCRSMWTAKAPAPMPPEFSQGEIDLSAVVAAINQNTDNIQQLESDVKISMNGLPSAISGTLLLENPDRLRLQAGFLGMTDLGVDIGSNEDVFWIWTKTSLPGQPSTILYARHDEFMQSAAGRQMRLHPKWIVNALGLIRFESTDEHLGPFIGTDKRLKIQSSIVMDGEQMTRVVKVHPRYGWIEQVALYDSENRRVAYANALDHRYDESAKAILPRFVQLYVFPESGETMELSIQIKRFNLNALYVDPENTWAMPQPNDVPTVDMSRIRPDLSLQQIPGSSLDTPRSTSTINAGNEQLIDRDNYIMARDRGYTVTR